MDLSRRPFLKLLLAAGAMPRVWASSDESPLLRVGIMTDTHVTPKRKSFERVEKAYALFRRKDVNVIVNCGDIANAFFPEAYKTYCEVRRAAYPDRTKAPDELYVWANHDTMNWPGKSSKGHPEAFAEVKRLLQIPNEAYDERVYAGFTFLVVPQWLDRQRYESMLDRACAANPDRPVFVFDHVPPRATTDNSRHWGDAYRREVLSRHPQVINITGHAHGSLRNEQNIWQGAFTNVSAGCLTYFDGEYVGTADNGNGQNHAVLVMELFANRAVFRRYSLIDGSEIGSEAPWTVVWPHDPQKAAYAPANAARRHAAPAFPEKASLSVCPSGAGLSVSWPRVETDGDVHFYRLELARREASGAWRTFAVREVRGDFWKEPAERRATLTDTLDAGYFQAGGPVRLTVAPVDFWNTAGRPLVWEGTPDLPAGELVWEGIPKGLEKDKWFKLRHWKELYDLPFVLPADGRYRAIVDFAAEQGVDETVAVSFKLKSTPYAAECSTPAGSSDLRYVFVSPRGWKKGDVCDLMVRYASAGRFQVKNIRVERI